MKFNMNYLEEMIGKSYGKLTVLREGPRKSLPSGRQQKRVECQCECGNKTLSYPHQLHENSSCRSCAVSKAKTRHGYARQSNWHPLYKVWNGIINRCVRDSGAGNKYYKAKGITVCERWLTFENFLEDMGERPEGMSIDRIDNSKGYSLDNCRWATAKEQIRNRSTTLIYEWAGMRMSLAEWCERAGMPFNLVRDRIRKQGWAFETALSTPKLPKGNSRCRLSEPLLSSSH